MRVMTNGDMTFLGDGRLMVNIHDTAECEGHGCRVHHASQWPLNTASVYCDEQRRQAFQRCEHGTTLRDLGDWEWTIATRGGGWDALVVLLRGRRPPLLFSDYDARPGPWPHTAARRCRSLR
jgi:hypothetical protein